MVNQFRQIVDETPVRSKKAMAPAEQRWFYCAIALSVVLTYCFSSSNADQCVMATWYLLVGLAGILALHVTNMRYELAVAYSFGTAVFCSFPLGYYCWVRNPDLFRVFTGPQVTIILVCICACTSIGITSVMWVLSKGLVWLGCNRGLMSLALPIGLIFAKVAPDFDFRRDMRENRIAHPPRVAPINLPMQSDGG